MIFLFLDGVGIGKAKNANPFYAARTAYLPFFGENPQLPDTTPVKGIDACLGVAGIPMSATGQTVLYTGVNVPQLLGEHKDSYPDKFMRKIIKENNIFSRLRKQRINARFLNAYPFCAHVFTPEHIRIHHDGEIRASPVFRSYFKGVLSVTSCMMLSSYMRPFGEQEILKETALYHDYSNQSLNSAKSSFPLFGAEKAAEIIYKTSRYYDFLLFEFFRTDMYGHGFELEESIKLVQALNTIVEKLLSLLDPQKDTFILTSDHGNLEDLTTQLHTTNPVPLITWGYKSRMLRDGINSLVDVTPAILDYYRDSSG